MDVISGTDTQEGPEARSPLVTWRQADDDELLYAPDARHVEPLALRVNRLVPAGPPLDVGDDAA